MPVNPASIGNAYKRSDEYRKQKRQKSQEKLKRRMAVKKDEEEGEGGEERKKRRLEANVPRTLDNSRQYGTSHLTSLPAASSSTAPAGSDAEDDDEEQEEEERGRPEDGGIDAIPASRSAPGGPPQDPKILITTSAKVCKETYTFAEELKSIFPGGEFFKRPGGRGFEMGRIARWASARDYDAVIVINEDRKVPNAITIVNLPYGPTAFFKLTSVQLAKQISGHARQTAHSPELILNNFQTRLGMSIGKLFGSLFPPLPQFEGRQVVTLHNQRDFLFFRRHRYMFKSIEKTALQEIGPRFTLKLKWLRKGLPAVTGGASTAVPVAPGAEEESEEEEVAEGGDGDDAEETFIEKEVQEGEEDDEDAEEEHPAPQKGGKRKIPPLNQQGEFEWQWKPKLETSRKTFFL